MVAVDAVGALRVRVVHNLSQRRVDRPTLPGMRRRLWAAGLAVPALLAGCADTSTQPARLPPLSSRAPSASPSPAPSPSPSPTEAQAVEAAVRFYFEGFNRAYAARNADELARGSAKSCPCRAAVAVVREIVSLGSVRGGDVSITMLRIAEMLPNLATVEVTLDSRGGQIVDAEGELVDTFRGEGVVRKAVVLSRDDGRWLPFRIDKLDG